jgi:transposase
MKETQATQKQNTPKQAVLYMSFELGSKEWKLTFGDGADNPRGAKVPSWDKAGVLREIGKARKKYRLPEDVRRLSVQEAGRDGFSVHRFLESEGIESLVVDSASIEVPRRGKHKKTDRLDGESLLRLLIRYDHGEKQAFRALHIPSEGVEASRHTHREMKRLKKERSGLTNRMRSLLVTQGIRAGKVDRKFLMKLQDLRGWDGEPLSRPLLEELLRDYERWELLQTQIGVIEASRRKELKEKKTKESEKVSRLMRLKGVGLESSFPLVREFFWRDFGDRREVASAAGLTPTPFMSGAINREQGISKAGNSRVRTLMIELAWMWRRHQPHSKLTRWFEERFGKGGKRMRRVGIVALARKLLVAFWRYLEEGIVPEGAVFSA